MYKRQDKKDASTKSKKRKAKASKTKEAPAAAKQGVKVESLTYKVRSDVTTVVKSDHQLIDNSVLR